MKLRILHVPNCPNVALLRQRLDEVLSGTDADVTVHVVENVTGAAASGMTGSPTLLVDGIDPFAHSGIAPSVSCRLYRDTAGRLYGAPSLTDLRRVLLENRR